MHFVKPADLSLIPWLHMVEGELCPVSCPLTATLGVHLWIHANEHMHVIFKNLDCDLITWAYLPSQQSAAGALDSPGLPKPNFSSS